MQTNITIGYKQIVNLAFLLSDEDKKKLISEVQKSIPQKKEREFGKYNGQIMISDDFNDPLEDLF